MDVITPPPPPPPLPPGRKKEFVCRCRERLRVWEADVQSETIEFDSGNTQFLAWFTCPVCHRKTYLSYESQRELMRSQGPDIPYK